MNELRRAIGRRRKYGGASIPIPFGPGENQVIYWLIMEWMGEEFAFPESADFWMGDSLDYGKQLEDLSHFRLLLCSPIENHSGATWGEPDDCQTLQAVALKQACHAGWGHTFSQLDPDFYDRLRIKKKDRT